jgi:hypothetical protein
MTGFFRGSGPCPDEPISYCSIWSGREDSNLRPLPPEDASPCLIEGHGAVNRHIIRVYNEVCSLFVLGKGSKRPLDHCPRGAAIGAIPSRTSTNVCFQSHRRPALHFSLIGNIGAFLRVSNPLAPREGAHA